MNARMKSDLYENRPISPLEAEMIAYHLSASFHEFKTMLRDMEHNIQEWHCQRMIDEEHNEWA
jgi:hypothetical protein